MFNFLNEFKICFQISLKKDKINFIQYLTLKSYNLSKTLYNILLSVPLINQCVVHLLICCTYIK